MAIEDSDLEVNGDVMEHDVVNLVAYDRIIIAIDFGTTFSSVAYTVLKKNISAENVDIRNVKCIGNYPGYAPPPGVPDMRQDVPTELWYDDGSLWCPTDRTTNVFDQCRDSESESGESSSSDDDRSGGEYGGLDSNVATQRTNAPTVAATQYWGFGVQQRLNMIHLPREKARPLTRFKLNLEEKRETEHLRSDLKTSLKSLRRRRIIKRDTDIYTHYLTHLLKHTKNQLQFSNNLHEDMLIQFVLSVPAKWPMNACRTMQTALELAVKEAGLGERANISVHNLFMISEPEAAAECILAEARSELFYDETMVIVDAGGGTVDAVAYKCNNEQPLRLSAEVVAPDSKLCGASYINERYEKKLLQKLCKEDYLEKNGKTLKSIVQYEVTRFENNEKRRIDTSDQNAPTHLVYIDDLIVNPEKHFMSNILELRRRHIREVFRESVEGVEEVLGHQLDLAEAAGYRVHKVILSGGFGQSPSVQSHLRRYLARRNERNGSDIELVVPENPSTTVARGAVLRALNKRMGPDRISQCSYGLLLSEPYDPEDCKAHRQTKCRIDNADGERYVDGTIAWQILTGERVKHGQEYVFDSRHTFTITRQKLVCAEELWMSDKVHPSHYRKSHPQNKGAEMVGSIEADMTFLRDEGLIKPRLPSKDSTYYASGKTHWEINYEVVMIVEGRSIRFEARWPLRQHLRPDQEQMVLAARLVGIAAAFKPGTA